MKNRDDDDIQMDEMDMSNEKVAKVMREFEAGTLKTPSGEIVTSKKQAMAIALSEARK